MLYANLNEAGKKLSEGKTKIVYSLPSMPEEGEAEGDARNVLIYSKDRITAGMLLDDCTTVPLCHCSRARAVLSIRCLRPPPWSALLGIVYALCS